MPSLPDLSQPKIGAHRFFTDWSYPYSRVGPAALVGGVLLIGVTDYVTGPLWSMSVFYLVPVALGSLLGGRRLGLGLAILSGACGLLSDVVFQPGYDHRAVATWNVVFMVVTLFVVVELTHRSRDRAEAALRAEAQGREFLAAAAHQLRTPLAGIRSTTEALMLAQHLDPDQQELLAALVREADRAGRLVGSLLRVARLDQHEPLPLRTTDLCRLGREEVARSASSWPHLHWSCDVATHPIMASCNADALSEAMANLLDNAHRHANALVQVTVRDAIDHAELIVNDDGPGLSADSVATAFGRFVSLDGRGGTGLGLPIARGIAEAHGGTLEYVEGSFVLRIPTRAPARSSVSNSVSHIAAA
jgi:signal transduction histidine kinase